MVLAAGSTVDKPAFRAVSCNSNTFGGFGKSADDVSYGLDVQVCKDCPVSLDAAAELLTAGQNMSNCGRFARVAINSSSVFCWLCGAGVCFHLKHCWISHRRGCC
jgi:hypothetical protein